MSLAGRRMIDGFKSKFCGRFLRLPSPPYGSPSYWTSVYRNFKPTDVFEWGNLTLDEDLMEYDYSKATTTARTANNKKSSTTTTTSFAETLNVRPQDKDKSVMMLGCGYSKLGEDMATNGWQRIVQVDISSKAISDLAERSNSEDDCIEDDATTLSAFNSRTMDAIVDKGLVDTLFLADDHAKIVDIMNSAHRVLKTKGVLIVFSLSEPNQLLPKLISNTTDLRDNDAKWHPMEVRQLDTVLLYRFQKAPETKAMPTIVKKRKSRSGNK